MIKHNQTDKDKTYSDRVSSYGIIENNLGQLAIVEHLNWGYILPGGKIEPNEAPNKTVKRESLEEIGYEVKNLKYFDKIETYYNVTSSIKKNTNIYCHNVADIFIGKIGEKVQEPIEKDTELHWFYPKEVAGKMEMDFQNLIIDKFIKQRS